MLLSDLKMSIMLKLFHTTMLKLKASGMAQHCCSTASSGDLQMLLCCCWSVAPASATDWKQRRQRARLTANGIYLEVAISMGRYLKGVSPGFRFPIHGLVQDWRDIDAGTSIKASLPDHDDLMLQQGSGSVYDLFAIFLHVADGTSYVF